MSRWRTLVAFVVLALWMPATSHCALEAAGFLEVGCCCNGDGDGTADGATGECAPIDRSLQSQSTTVVTCSPVLVLEYTLERPLEALASAPLVEYVEARRPDDWLRRWNFEHRMAPPARAPSGKS
jgi:hypothetical protein